MTSKDLIPNAFWTALSNQNVTDFGQPQWSIVVNDAGIQCSIFFENPNSSNSSVNSTSTEYCQAKLESQTSNSSRDAVSPIKPERAGIKRPRIETTAEQVKVTSETRSDGGSENEEEIDCTNESTDPTIMAPTPPITSQPSMVNLPLLQQFFVQQLQAQQQQQYQQQIAHRTSFPKVESQLTPATTGSEIIETPKPGDLSLIPAENRRRLTNLREEAAASRLSVTAFIRRGALLYFDSEELAVNRLHTLNQSKLHALELETKFFFGEVPQQLFRRTIAIQQSQIRSKRSSASLNADRSNRSLVTQAPPPSRPSLNPTLFSSLVTSAASTPVSPPTMIGSLPCPPVNVSQTALPPADPSAQCSIGAV